MHPVMNGYLKHEGLQVSAAINARRGVPLGPASPVYITQLKNCSANSYYISPLLLFLIASNTSMKPKASALFSLHWRCERGWGPYFRSGRSAGKEWGEGERVKTDYWDPAK